MNRLVVEADLVVTTESSCPTTWPALPGGANPSCRGWRGGRPSRATHSMLVRPESAPGRLEGNPIHQEMLEAARRAESISS